MAVRFLKSTTASTLNRTLRPSGYTFPTGLNQPVKILFCAETVAEIATAANA